VGTRQNLRIEQDTDGRCANPTTRMPTLWKAIDQIDQEQAQLPQKKTDRTLLDDLLVSLR
jgi:hypothetical protein